MERKKREKREEQEKEEKESWVVHHVALSTLEHQWWHVQLLKRQPITSPRLPCHPASLGSKCTAPPN